MALNWLYAVVVLPICGFISKHQSGVGPNWTESLCCGCAAVGGWLFWFLMVTWLNAPPEDGTEVLNHVGGSNLMMVFLLIHFILLVSKHIQGGSNMTGTNCDLFTYK
jgi:hypothetical protein